MKTNSIFFVLMGLTLGLNGYAQKVCIVKDGSPRIARENVQSTQKAVVDRGSALGHTDVGAVRQNLHEIGHHEIGQTLSRPNLIVCLEVALERLDSGDPLAVKSIMDRIHRWEHKGFNKGWEDSGDGAGSITISSDGHETGGKSRILSQTEFAHLIAEALERLETGDLGRVREIIRTLLLSCV